MSHPCNYLYCSEWTSLRPSVCPYLRSHPVGSPGRRCRAPRGAHCGVQPQRTPGSHHQANNSVCEIIKTMFFDARLQLSSILQPVFQIRIILMWIWIRGSTSGNSGSGYGSGSGSDSNKFQFFSVKDITLFLSQLWAYYSIFMCIKQKSDFFKPCSNWSILSNIQQMRTRFYYFRKTAV